MPSSSLLTRDLRSALETGDLTIAYQAQYELDGSMPHDGSVRTTPVAVEALCRWSHPVFGAVSPERFIPLAERGRFLGDVDQHVFARAAAQVARWRDSGHAVALSANASPEYFSFGYIDAVMSCLDEFALDPAGVTIEITEAPTPQLRPEMRASIETMRAIGIAISVDDFDAGDTTVAMLETMPIDEVKLDRSLTQRSDAAADAAVAAVAELSEARGWRLVAEGIETFADLARARTRGCHRGQGFLWGKPMDAEEMTALFARS